MTDYSGDADLFGLGCGGACEFCGRPAHTRISISPNAHKGRTQACRDCARIRHLAALPTLPVLDPDQYTPRQVWAALVRQRAARKRLKAAG